MLVIYIEWERKEFMGRGATGFEGALCGWRRGIMSAELLSQLRVLIGMLIELARHRRDS